MVEEAKQDHAPLQRTAVFRFYEELNDFLPPSRRKRSFRHTFTGTPSVKDTIEALGVPHTEVDLILINGASAGFDQILKGGERVAVYPVFERLDINPAQRLRARPLRTPRFILDVHLGKLARYLRMLGFDTRYRNDLADPEIIAIARSERRIILTRDLGILKHGDVTHGYFVRSTEPREQVREIVQALHLHEQMEPFTRCMDCNAPLEAVEKEAVQHLVPQGVLAEMDTFQRCSDCGKVYWAGSHFDRMQRFIHTLRTDEGTPSEGRHPHAHH